MKDIKGVRGLKDILVCVTQQKTCERLILRALQISAGTGGHLHVIHVTKEGWKILDHKSEAEAMEYLFEISKSAGANLIVLKSDDVTGAIAGYAKENGISCLVLGQSPPGKAGDFAGKLANLLPGIEIIEVP